LVEVRNDSNWDTVESALGAINYPNVQSTELPAIPKPAEWQFEFSDGSTVKQDYLSGWYHIQPEIDTHMKNDDYSQFTQ
jgi:hypothetical protein